VPCEQAFDASNASTTMRCEIITTHFILLSEEKARRGLFLTSPRSRLQINPSERLLACLERALTHEFELRSTAQSAQMCAYDSRCGEM
jgi:hypothetical protein